MTTIAPSNFIRLYQSPGPVYEGEAEGNDWWRLGRAMYAAGIRPGDIIHNAFSYHLTPAGMMVEGGARAIGCTVVPAGTGQTEQQVQAIEHLRASAYAGTPSFLKIILDKAKETGADVSSLTKAVVSGEALPEALRGEFKSAGILALQAYASADLGLIAYESKAMEGLIVDESILVEIVRPGTGEHVPTGDIGEVVVSTLNREYPLIRFATGDLSSVMRGLSPCGRTGLRLTGWKGRADQSTKVKGMFVTPGQIADVVKRHPEIQKARLVISQDGSQDVMTLMCETAESGDALAAAVAETLQALCKMKGVVEFTEPGGLADDGLVIEDRRSVE
jgi:phenylacetate-CoA ligase